MRPGSDWSKEALMAHQHGAYSKPARPGALVTLLVAAGLLALASPACDDTPQADERYSLEDVAERDSEERCWLAIDGAVYDVTDYLSDHPPGKEEILPHCGSDATDAFGEVGHSSTAEAVRSRHQIGEIADE